VTSWLEHDYNVRGRIRCSLSQENAFMQQPMATARGQHVLCVSGERQAQQRSTEAKVALKLERETSKALRLLFRPTRASETQLRWSQVRPSFAVHRVPERCPISSGTSFFHAPKRQPLDEKVNGG
jgi:hypothetical protein